MSNDSNDYYEKIDFDPIHPGFFVKDELEARGWTLKDLARKSGYCEQTISLVVSRKKTLSTDLAKAISNAFGVSNELLSNVQTSYDRAVAKQRDLGNTNHDRTLSAYPIDEMIERGWLRDTRQKFIVSQMIRFFETTGKDQIPYVSPAFAAMKTDYSNSSPAQLAWLYRVRHIARQIDAPEYSEEHLRNALPRLRELMSEPDDVQFVPDLLLNCGVRLIVVEALKDAKICGATCWLSIKEPVIGLTTRYDRLDNFWFVLRHEIEHVLCAHGKEIPQIDGDTELGLSNVIDEHEKLANDASLGFMVSPLKFEKFIGDLGVKVTENDIRDFASREHVHPSIVAGLLRRHFKKFDLLNTLNLKIRSTLLKNLVYDGWGKVVPVEL